MKKIETGTNETKKEKNRSVIGDILADFKSNWWKYLISVGVGAGAGFGGTKLLDKKFGEKPEEAEAEAEPMEVAQWEGPAISDSEQ